MQEKRAFVPKARLIQILGEHLIKDATVGLLELVKNSYDADATSVQVVLAGVHRTTGKILIRDNGTGMSVETFADKWMNPAAGHKQIQKDKKQRTALGRLPLGEKGVGRFATQQIGKRLLMVSKTTQMAEELVVDVDWSDFDDYQKNLSDVTVNYSTRQPEFLRGNNSGTILEMSDLRRPWTENDVQGIANCLKRMKSPFKGAKDFNIKLIFKDCPEEFAKYEDLEMSDILDKAHYKFFGVVDKDGILDFEYDFKMPDLKATKKSGRINLVKEYLDMSSKDAICGGFILNLHAYSRVKKYLKASTVDQKDLKSLCGISVYRDGMRILPYGEPGNDWLDLGYRRIQSPGATISNDQVIGLIEIDQLENNLLKDKTNREGLIENEAYLGFRKLVFCVIQTLEKEMENDRERINPKKTKTSAENLAKAVADLKTSVSTVIEQASNIRDPKAKECVSAIDKARGEIDDVVRLIGETTEEHQIERKTLLNLAGTGLAAERFTHEFARLVSGANWALDRLTKQILMTSPKIKKEVDAIRAALEALKNDIRLLGPMFYVKKVAREKELDVKSIVENTLLLQEVAMKKDGIEPEIRGESFVIVMREGSCMQVFDNLLDNSIYWLSRKSERDKRKIRVILDKSQSSVYVSDSGPGVIGRYKDRIFDPFFSMKGEDGRGLGLYIAREILQEKRWEIVLAEKDEHDGLLNGASFKILFTVKDLA